MNSMRITGILKNVHLELPQRKVMTLLFSIIDSWASQSCSMVSNANREGVLVRWLSWNNDLNNDHCFAVDGRIQVWSYLAPNHLITLKTKPSHRWLPIFIPFFFFMEKPLLILVSAQSDLKHFTIWRASASMKVLTHNIDIAWGIWEQSC